MRKKKKGIKAFLRRVFHVKQTRVSKKQREKIRQEIIADMIANRKEMIIDGKDYDAALDKYVEDMIIPYQVNLEAPDTSTHEIVSSVRCSDLPQFLLLLGVRIRG